MDAQAAQHSGGGWRAGRWARALALVTAMRWVHETPSSPAVSSSTTPGARPTCRLRRRGAAALIVRAKAVGRALRDYQLLGALLVAAESTGSGGGLPRHQWWPTSRRASSSAGSSAPTRRSSTRAVDILTAWTARAPSSITRPPWWTMVTAGRGRGDRLPHGQGAGHGDADATPATGPCSSMVAWGSPGSATPSSTCAGRSGRSSSSETPCTTEATGRVAAGGA
jgi:hypothetical protein